MDETETPKCCKCGKEPVGEGGVLGVKCKTAIAAKVSNPWGKQPATP